MNLFKKTSAVILALCMFPCAIMAQGNMYQIDLIIFSHPSGIGSDLNETPMLTVDSKQSIFLQPAGSSRSLPYHQLPHNMSQLHREYWALSHKADYQIIAQTSWLQPSNNQRAVYLSGISQSDWDIEGIIRVRQSNYYLLNLELLLSKNSTPKNAFIFKQSQRLKPNTVYYIDHPQAGMLIKVHSIG